jgi:hypothetical protein
MKELLKRNFIIDSNRLDYITIRQCGCSLCTSVISSQCGKEGVSNDKKSK